MMLQKLPRVKCESLSASTSASTLPKVVSGLRLDAVVLIEREDNAQSFEWTICYEFPGVITLTPSL